MRRRFRRNQSDEPTGSDAPDDGPAGADEADPVGGGGAARFGDVLADSLDEADRAAALTAEPIGAAEPLAPSPAAIGPGPADGPSADAGPAFWTLYDRARADIELIALPTSIPVLVVGPLAPARAVIERARVGAGIELADVFVLTPDRDQLDGREGWTVVGQPSDLVAVLDEERPTPPLLVLDVPAELPAFVGPLVARLRQSGVELVRYVLDDDPDDEDVATWVGELGQPSVLDLAAAVEPRRVLELFDRGEPVVSVAGRDLCPDLLVAFRADVLAADRVAEPLHLH